MNNDPRLQIVDFLPRLRRFSYALTGDSDKGDDLVQETCARALSRLDQWIPGTRLDSWMFRIAQNIWLDQRRAHKVRGDSVDIDQAYDIAGADGREVTENSLTLKEVSKCIAGRPRLRGRSLLQGSGGSLGNPHRNRNEPARPRQARSLRSGKPRNRTCAADQAGDPPWPK